MKYNHFLFTSGYAIIQIPDILISVYAYLERWIRRSSITDKDPTKTRNTAQPLTKKQISRRIRISRLEENMRKRILTRTPASKAVQQITQLREETNKKIEKLERILEEMIRKPET